MMKTKIKRPLSVDGPSFRYGVLLAAEVASDYDKSNSHPFLVSECILGKLNLLKGKPRRNEMADKINQALTRLERKIDSLEGTMRFMTMGTRKGKR